MFMTIELRHIEQILALDKHRNFARAAKELNLTQPALSRNLRVLEEQLGVMLFSRSRPQIEPTVFGQHVITVGKSILQDSRRLELEIAQLNGLERGVLRVGAGPLPADIYMGAVFAKMSRLYPQHHLHLQVNWPQDLVKLLRSQLLDIVVADIRLIDDVSDLDITPLPEVQGFWVCRAGHPLAQEKAVSYRQLLEFPVALFHLPPSMERTIAKRANLPLDQWNDAPNGKIECYNTSVLLRTIMGCDAVGVAADSLYQEELAAGDIVRLSLKTPEISSRFGAIVQKKYLKSPSVKTFTKYLLEVAGEYC
ncbi:MAG: LysR family transcriptional regulator [Proteobacteria bacterium]|nr:LysR family transcriptional regulator [Pseudomonadota bacterium]